MNLFAFRATDPKELLRVKKNTGDISGWENNSFIKAVAHDSEMVACAWGRLHKHLAYRQPQVLRLLESRANGVMCLGLNADMSPKHPLYLRNDIIAKPWNLEAAV